ncbi:MAG: hypothetical protein AAF388_03310 [Bacteroidota bacterium]
MRKLLSLSLLLGLFSGISMVQAQNQDASMLALLDRIEVLEDQKEDLKMVNKAALDAGELQDWKQEKKALNQQLQTEKNKLRTLQQANSPFNNAWANPYGGIYGWAGNPYWGGFYGRRFINRRPVVVVRRARVCRS